MNHVHVPTTEGAAVPLETEEVADTAVPVVMVVVEADIQVVEDSNDTRISGRSASSRSCIRFFPTLSSPIVAG